MMAKLTESVLRTSLSGGGSMQELVEDVEGAFWLGLVDGARLLQQVWGSGSRSQQCWETGYCISSISHF